MSSSFELDDVDHFTAGTVGPPGQRVFFLQIGSSGSLVSLRLEKSQVAALATYLSAMLDDLSEVTGESGELAPGAVVSDQPAPDMDLVEPAVAEWVVGGLGVTYDEANDRVLLVAEEFVPPPSDDEGEPTGGHGLPDSGESADDDGFAADKGASVRFRVTRAQVAAFVRRSAEVVIAGRPPCPLCGNPLDADGHVCVRLNGHRGTSSGAAGTHQPDS